MSCLFCSGLGFDLALLCVYCEERPGMILEYFGTICWADGVTRRLLRVWDNTTFSCCIRVCVCTRIYSALDTQETKKASTLLVRALPQPPHPPPNPPFVSSIESRNNASYTRVRLSFLSLSSVKSERATHQSRAFRDPAVGGNLPRQQGTQIGETPRDLGPEFFFPCRRATPQQPRA